MNRILKPRRVGCPKHSIDARLLVAPTLRTYNPATLKRPSPEHTWTGVICVPVDLSHTIPKEQELSAEGAQYESQGQAPAPKARNMKARGKREAKRNASPLVNENTNLNRALKVRNINVDYSALSELHRHLGHFYQGRRALRCSALAPGFHIPRLWRWYQSLVQA